MKQTGLLFLVSLAQLTNCNVEVQLGVLIERPDGSVETGTVFQRSIEYENKERLTLKNVTIIPNITVLDEGHGVDAIFKVCDMLKLGLSGLVSYTSCDTLEYLESQQRLFNMPHIAISWTYCPYLNLDPDSFTISMSEHGGLLTDAVAALLSQMAWKTVVIFYDETIPHHQLSLLMRHLSLEYVKSVVIRLPLTPSDEVEIHLEALRTNMSSYNQFLIMTNHHTVSTILSVANTKQMLTAKHFWLIANYEIPGRSVTPYMANYSNVVVLRKVWPSPESVLPCGSPALEHVHKIAPNPTIADVYMIEAILLFSETIHNLVAPALPEPPQLYCENRPVEYWTEGADLMNELRNSNHSGIFGPLTFDPNGYRKDANYDICSLDTSKTGNTLTHIGRWDSERKLQLDKPIFPNVNRGFDNKTFVIATLQALPFTVKNVTENGTKWEGLCIDLLNELAKRMTFKYVIIEPEDGQFGAVNPDGSFTGLVGMVIEKKADFAIGPISITAEREAAVDFTKPYMEDGVGIMMRRPGEDAQQMLRMFRPFGADVWAALAVALVIVGVLLYFVNRTSPYEDYHLAQPVDEVVIKPKLSFNEDMWCTYASFMEQGGERLPMAMSSRIVLGFWWLFTILLIASYTANLAAFLTVTISETPIKTLQDLADQSDIQPLVKTGTNMWASFREGGTELYAEIWEKMKEGPGVTSTEDAVQMVRDGNYGYMADKSALDFIVQQDCEAFIMAEEEFNKNGYGFLFPEESPLLDDFSMSIVKTLEAGLMERWRKQWWPRSDRCAGSGPMSEANMLDLRSTGGPFLVFLGSVAVAFLCLFSEFFYCKVLMKPIRKQSDTDDTTKYVG